MYDQANYYISPNYSKSQYKKLNLQINSDENTWNQAIDMFRDRIENRFIKQIDTLLNDVNTNGFIIMSIDCLLVDTFYQFKNGLDKSTNNSEKYPAFLLDSFNDVFDNVKLAEKFYKKIRCGILHSAQTKKGSCLTTEETYIIANKRGYMNVSVKGFTERLKKYFYSYVLELTNPENIEIRTNFIKKMNFICNK